MSEQLETAPEELDNEIDRLVGKLWSKDRDYAVVVGIKLCGVRPLARAPSTSSGCARSSATLRPRIG